MDSKSNIIIIGAGPAGLTAALELVRAGHKPIVIEADNQVGGISKTINHQGNRMDLGGHRFFSKSDWVMDWWQDILPLSSDAQAAAIAGTSISYQNRARTLGASTRLPSDPDAVMLIRPRLSRIYYLRKFFDYPVKLNLNTIRNLGLIRIALIGSSYCLSQLFPRKPESTLEDFLINRFGNRLYRTFFKDYTEKVWGVACDQISAEWGAQRIKGLSITKALVHAVRQWFSRDASAQQTQTETSLIERFLYPKYGPGQMWEEVCRQAAAGGARILFNHRVTRLESSGDEISAVWLRESGSDEEHRMDASSVISTMPVQSLIAALGNTVPESIRNIASGLPYRDFITVGLLVPRMYSPPGGGVTENGVPPDNWIYIQEPDVKLGRLQIFNNWSPEMVADRPKAWIGLEYFCNEGDSLWRMTDSEFMRFAAEELEKIGLISAAEVEGSTIVRVPKAYPAYFGSYEKFGEVKQYLKSFSNLHLVGRNGMHRYNNQDHSMLSAKYAVDLILGRETDRDKLWDINAEQEYHEEK
jgi:protoporphyrinogen oxidase